MRSNKNSISLKILDNSNTEDLQSIIEGFVAAGFPSPAGDYIENDLSLKNLLVRNESSTFFVQVKGNSMQDANIFDGDILVVDKSLNPSKESILVCFIDGEFTVKRVNKIGKDYFLIPANKEFQPIKIEEGSDFRLWGVVTYVIHKTQ